MQWEATCTPNCPKTGPVSFVSGGFSCLPRKAEYCLPSFSSNTSCREVLNTSHWGGKPSRDELKGVNTRPPELLSLSGTGQFSITNQYTEDFYLLELWLSIFCNVLRTLCMSFMVVSFRLYKRSRWASENRRDTLQGMREKQKSSG